MRKKSIQLELFKEDKPEKNTVYYNDEGEPLPWELEQAIEEGYKEK